MENNNSSQRKREIMPETRPRLSYLICASPRSGSTLLSLALQNTGLAGMPEEMFRPGVRDETVDRLRIGAAHDMEYVSHLLRYATSSNGIFATKMHGFQTNMARTRIEAYAGRRFHSLRSAFDSVFPNLHYIWITREDKAREAVSYYRAIMSDTWHLTRRETSLENTAGPADIPYDLIGISTCESLVQANDLYWERYFKHHAIAPLHLVYETFVRNYESTMIEVFDFLGLPRETPFPPPPLAKMGNARSLEWVQRYRREANACCFEMPPPEKYLKWWAPY